MKYGQGIKFSVNFKIRVQKVYLIVWNHKNCIEPQWVSIDIDLGKTKGMKKILMKHDENVSEVVNKFAQENSMFKF